jgi:DNA-binding NtrC family response regulator
MTCTTAPTSVQLMGSDPRIAHVHEIVRRVADAEATVLIRGETGTGKEVVARLLHTSSIRAREPFIAVNCGALPDSLLEAELFGATKGAFTGAVTARVGKFEAAQRGTIFLDEVASMGQSMQVALLRVLQSGEFTPVGTAIPRLSRARVVAAVNTDLQTLVASGSFRADLYYRLNVIQLELPPLRERSADVMPLAEHFLERFSVRYGKVGLRLSDTARRCLAAHSYPGNVRELENAIHRAVVMAVGPTLSAHDLPSDFGASLSCGAATPGRTTAFHHAKAVLVAHFEREFLTAALLRTQGVVVDAARQVGLSERVFHVKLRKYGIRAAT